MTTKSVYFPNLNALRFIAVFIVVISHIEQFKDMFGFPSYSSNPSIQIIGKLSVVLFFVLSGFLITNLLLIENKTTGTISVKNFYIRRILRIWPLYFLIIILAFFILPNIHAFHMPGSDTLNDHFTGKLLFFGLLFPNLALSLYGPVNYLGHTWSIGTEEQFYIIWPLAIKKIKNKPLFMICVIVLYMLLKFTLLYYSNKYPTNNSVYVLNLYLKRTPIDCMAIGGLFSILCNNSTSFFVSFKKVLFKKGVQFAVFITTITLLLIGVNFNNLQYEIYSILFGAIISNLALNNNCIINLESIKPINYLGKISYGIYMYHPIIIVIVLKTLLKIHHSNSILIYIAAFSISIIISSISYRFFEKPFITKKIKFSSLISGDNA